MQSRYIINTCFLAKRFVKYPVISWFIVTYNNSKSHNLHIGCTFTSIPHVNNSCKLSLIKEVVLAKCGSISHISDYYKITGSTIYFHMIFVLQKKTDNHWKFDNVLGQFHSNRLKNFPSMKNISLMILLSQHKQGTSRNSSKLIGIILFVHIIFKDTYQR